jgi:hypothetical protein
VDVVLNRYQHELGVDYPLATCRSFPCAEACTCTHDVRSGVCLMAGRVQQCVDVRDWYKYDWHRNAPTRQSGSGEEEKENGTEQLQVSSVQRGYITTDLQLARGYIYMYICINRSVMSVMSVVFV